MWKGVNQRISNLPQLNTALMTLNPSISGIDLSMLQTPGATLAMLDAEIDGNNARVYDGVKRADVLNSLKQGLANRVNTHPIVYNYDNHGDKHFPNGPQGTKFTHGKDVVNPVLRGMIALNVGRIRRDARGRNQTYYLTAAPIAYSKGMSVCIQVDYAAAPESITYHGYPDGGVAIYVLSRSKGGVAIAR